MFILEALLCLLLLVCLHFFGFAYKNFVSDKYNFEISNILSGFIFFVLLGTVISIFSFGLFDNSIIWKFSYVFLITTSLVYLFKTKSLIKSVKEIFCYEVIFFLLVFILIVALRMSNPDILNTEKIMEYMIWSSTMSSTTFIPNDLWFHNSGISYYSFGYFVFSAIPSVLNIQSNVAYNMILPTVVSFTFLASFYFFRILYVTKRNFLFLVFITITFIYVFFLGNFVTVIEFFNHLTIGNEALYKFIDIDGITEKKSIELFWPVDNWWWFSISRVISYKNPDMFYSDYTINEFPAFSFILGDVHPHILVLPFVLLCFNLIFKTFLSRNFSYHNIFWINITFLISSLINPWYLVVLFCYAVISSIFSKNTINFRKLFTKNELILLSTLIFQVIIVFSINNPGNHLSFPYISPIHIASRFHHLFFYWAFALVPITVYLSLSLLKHKDYNGLLKSFLLILLFSFIFPAFSKNLLFNLELFIHYLIVNIFFAFLLSSILIYIKHESDLKKNIMILLFSSVLILYGTEHIYVVDQFNNRMNTIFKFYFINYIILNFISVYCVINLIHALKFYKRILVVSILIFVLLPSLWWSTASIKTRYNENIGPFSLDGLAYLNHSELEAIEYIKANIPKSKIVLEGVGKSYTKSNFISAATGRATVLGWTNHQLQWRNDIEKILSIDSQIKEFYINPSKENTLIENFNIEFFILSNFEKKIYGLNNDPDFDKFKLVFHNKDYKIFQIND